MVGGCFELEVHTATRLHRSLSEQAKKRVTMLARVADLDYQGGYFFCHDTVQAECFWNSRIISMALSTASPLTKANKKL